MEKWDQTMLNASNTGDMRAETQAKRRRREEQPGTRTSNTMTKMMRRPRRRRQQSNDLVDRPLQGLGRRGELQLADASFRDYSRTRDCPRGLCTTRLNKNV